jgi:hypothetical protein
MENSNPQATYIPAAHNPVVIKKHHVSKLLFIPFFLIIVAVSIYTGIYLYYLQNHTLPIIRAADMQAAQTTQGQTTTQVQNTGPMPTAQVTPSWTLYQNATDHFSFEYPDSLQISEKPYAMGIDSISLSDSGQPNSTEFQLLAFPELIGNYIGQSFNTYYTMPNGATKVVPASAQTQAQQITKIANTTVNGLRSVEVTTTSYPAKPNSPSDIGRYIEIGNNVLLLMTGPDNQETLNGILNTFSYSP